MDISFIIVNFNTDALTLQAVNSVFEFTAGLECEVVVVDNNSIETQLPSLLKDKSKVKFIPLNDNMGFGKANNYALPFCNGKYVFLLNSDAYLINNSMKELFSFMEEKSNFNIAICGTDLLDSNREKNLAYGNFLTEDKILFDLGVKKFEDKTYLKEINAISKKCDFSEVTEVDYVSGAALMIRKSCIEQLGLFDPRFHMYYEDMELCYRYKKNGFKVVLNPAITVIHLGGQSWVSNQNDSVKSGLIVLKSKYIFSLSFLSASKAYFYYLLSVLFFRYNYLLITIKRRILKLVR